MRITQRDFACPLCHRRGEWKAAPRQDAYSCTCGHIIFGPELNGEKIKVTVVK